MHQAGRRGPTDARRDKENPNRRGKVARTSPRNSKLSGKDTVAWGAINTRKKTYLQGPLKSEQQQERPQNQSVRIGKFSAFSLRSPRRTVRHFTIYRILLPLVLTTRSCTNLLAVLFVLFVYLVLCHRIGRTPMLQHIVVHAAGRFCIWQGFPGVLRV